MQERDEPYSRKEKAQVDEYKALWADVVQLARLGLGEQRADVETYVRRMIRRYRELDPELTNRLQRVVADLSTRASPMRRTLLDEIPVDLETRLKLVRVDAAADLPVDPIWREDVSSLLNAIVLERQRRDALTERGLDPTRSILFTGPPGVGKTLAARWLGRQLGIPLLVLDLSAVMSSYLGRTGNNVRHVLEHAKRAECILLLDELDAIAKRRDDHGEIGELKRLVTVLLQEIDGWPATSLLIAATNHEELLDSAVWRRFELVVRFPMPGLDDIREAVVRFLGTDREHAREWVDVLAISLEGRSFSDIERVITKARREAAVSAEEVPTRLAAIVKAHVSSLSRRVRHDVASRLVAGGLASQRLASELTGVSRDTIRKLAGNSGATGE